MANAVLELCYSNYFLVGRLRFGPARKLLTRCLGGPGFRQNFLENVEPGLDKAWTAHYNIYKLTRNWTLNRPGPVWNLVQHCNMQLAMSIWGKRPGLLIIRTFCVIIIIDGFASMRTVVPTSSFPPFFQEWTTVYQLPVTVEKQKLLTGTSIRTQDLKWCITTTSWHWAIEGP